MNDQLRELYQEIIIDHNRNPRHHKILTNANRQARGMNPLCGDQLTIYLNIQDDTITQASFTGKGCAISQASASLMMETLQGESVAKVQQLFQEVHHFLTEEHVEAGEMPNKLQVLGGVKAYPARVKCATLAWHALEAALKKEAQPVCTE